jgi:hypothetical protein
MKFVVAGNRHEYNAHINKMGYNPNEYVYVSDPLQLRGLETIEGFYLGSYKDRPDLNQINELIQIIKHKSKVPKGSFYTDITATPINNTGLGVQPTSIMLKNAGAWQIYDINNGEVK